MGYSRTELHHLSVDGSKKLNESPEWHPISTRAKSKSEEDPDTHFLMVSVHYDGDFILPEASRYDLLKAGRMYYRTDINPPVESGWFHEFTYVPGVPEEGNVYGDMTVLRGDSDQFGDLELYDGDEDLVGRLQDSGGKGDILSTLEEGLSALATETEQDSIGIYFSAKRRNMRFLDNLFLCVYLNGEQVFTLEEGYV